MTVSSSREPHPIRRGKDVDPCAATPDPTAPAGSSTSLGAKSDCNGRPSTDDSVVEAKDELGPLVTPPEQNQPQRRR